MRKLFLTTILGLCGLLGVGSFCFGQSLPPENTTTAPATMEYGETLGAESGISADCGGAADCGFSADVCAPCADSCYADCYGGCYGGCGMYGGCGLLPFVKDVATVALTPVHWVAGLLSCGTWADCGCAPLPCRTYSNPCDACGNWVGCDYCGGAGCSACANTGNVAAPAQNGSAVDPSSDYLNYNNVETIHQRKARSAQEMMSNAAPQNNSPTYQYNENLIEGAALPNRSAKKVAAVPGKTRSTQSAAAQNSAAARRDQSVQPVQKQAARQVSAQPVRQPVPQYYRNAR